MNGCRQNESPKMRVKNVLMMDLFHLLSSPDVNWWTGVVWITCGLLWCFYQLFGLSFWRHPFTAEHPLLRQWCSDTFLQIWWRNKLILISDGMWVSTFSAYYLFFWWITPASLDFKISAVSHNLINSTIVIICSSSTTERVRCWHKQHSGTSSFQHVNVMP